MIQTKIVIGVVLMPGCHACDRGHFFNTRPSKFQYDTGISRSMTEILFASEPTRTRGLRCLDRANDGFSGHFRR